jgi:hypothetical protein
MSIDAPLGASTKADHDSSLIQNPVTMTSDLTASAPAASVHHEQHASSSSATSAVSVVGSAEEDEDDQTTIAQHIHNFYDGLSFPCLVLDS